MNFLIVNRVNPGVTDEQRMAVREAHVAYTASHRELIQASGRLQSDDGSAVTGGFFLLACPDRSAAEEFYNNEPYVAAKIWQAEVFSAAQLPVPR
ncbi:MAG: hypothetical protein J2P57_19410 [Acidimicrobiaceae bacterium]|nr:hypothetical protein [Acidimicrobiaceae bacterium]